MRFLSYAGTFVTFVIFFLPVADIAPQAAAPNGGTAGSEPELFVVCTGWHALCSATTDCKVSGDNADCDCLRVNEIHMVETTEIQDAAIRRLTLATCTAEHHCAVDEAPVCAAIRSEEYQVDGVLYKWVSTYSYRGWCGLIQEPPKACDPAAPGYVGDRTWAVCDAAPCTEISNPANPERPLRCRCRVRTGAFVGPSGRCAGDNGGIMSSAPAESWDFDHNTYPFVMPGYEFVQGACAQLKSDPP